MKTALYMRVSRDDLHCENQLRILEQWAKVRTLDDADSLVFSETGSTRKTRPVKEQLMRRFREGEISTIVVVRIDRFARSLQELVMDVREIVDKGGTFVSIQNGFEFNKNNFGASNQLMFNIFSCFAEFEREIIRERTLEGLARVKAQGKRLGRPRKNPPSKGNTALSSQEA